MEEFKTYLKGKKIDPEAFQQHAPEQYQAFEALFAQVHPKSFTAQKLFLLNKLRRNYHYTPPVETSSAATESLRPRPKAVKRPVRK